MCTNAKCKSLGIKCNTNIQGTNSAHTTVYVDFIYWYTINICAWSSCAHMLYTSPYPLRKVLLRYSPARKNDFDPVKMDRRADVNQKKKGFP